MTRLVFRLAVWALVSWIAAVGLAQQQSAPATLENLLDRPERSLQKASADGASKPRQPVPDQAEIKQAQDLIQQAFEDDYKAAAENPEPLIQKLLAAAEKTEESSRKYAMMLEAEKAAVIGGDHGRALELIDIRAAEFAVDGIQSRVERLAEFLTPKVKKDPEALGRLYEYTIETARQAMERNSLQQAKASAEMAASIAKSLFMVGKAQKNDALVADGDEKQTQARALIKAIAGRASLLTEYQAALETLKTTPDDLTANAVAGRYLCFAEGDWEKGLPFLAKGNQKEMAELAAQELEAFEAAAPDAKHVFEVANAWWAMAASQAEKSLAADMMYQHASILYSEIAEDVADPLDKALATKRAAANATAVANAPRKTRRAVPNRVILNTIRNSIGMDLKLLPAGAFTMGDAGGDPSEALHGVTLTNPFYIGVYEVTNAQWKRLMGSEPSNWKDEDRPVEQVSWEDAVDFCRKLSALPEERTLGRVYRLPTEAEWEYACRAGTTTRYSFGDDELRLGEHGWFNANSGGQTHPVGQKRPNRWGIHDMHGNVWEWCSDWHGGYPNSAVTDPQGPSLGSSRVIRGGSWRGGDSPWNCRSAKRAWSGQSRSHNALGFRVVLSTSGPNPPSVGKVSAITPVQTGAQPPQTPWNKTSFPTGPLIIRPTIRNSVGVDLRFIPAGTFMMGDASGRLSKAPHQVTLTQPFYIGVYEITNAQWKRVMGSAPGNWKDDDRPAEQVSWEDAMEFCRKLSAVPEERTAGRVYRLPTEAEWEYACRAGTTTAYSFGDAELQFGDHGWSSENSGGQTHPVGQKRPNQWGLFDMHGNVWEWCSDWFGGYPNGAVTDPQGVPEGSKRVNRGGSWRHFARENTSAFRRWNLPSYRDSIHGFRLAMTLTGSSSLMVARSGWEDITGRLRGGTRQGNILLLAPRDHVVSTDQYVPPIEIEYVCLTTKHNIRLGYACSAMIFNWERNVKELRLDGGPANGRHVMNAGELPVGQMVTIRQVVTPNEMAVYVNGQKRASWLGDFSGVNEVIEVFGHDSDLLISSVRVRKLQN